MVVVVWWYCLRIIISPQGCDELPQAVAIYRKIKIISIVVYCQQYHAWAALYFSLLKVQIVYFPQINKSNPGQDMTGVHTILTTYPLITMKIPPNCNYSTKSVPVPISCQARPQIRDKISRQSCPRVQLSSLRGLSEVSLGVCVSASEVVLYPACQERSIYGEYERGGGLFIWN